MSERRTLGCGILIGMGMILILTGFFGWFSASYLSGTLRTLLRECGIDANRHYIFNDLNRLVYTHIVFTILGFVSLLIGVIGEWLQWRALPVAAKEISLRDRLVGALGGGGGALALGSLINYLLWETSLYLLIVFEAIGIFLLTLAIIIYTRK